MANDMTWEQKCRISALRAACASQFFNDPPPNESINSADKDMTKRILARAEEFRNALLHNGRLDDIDSFIERVSDVPRPVMNEETFVATCKHCLTAIQLFNPFDYGNARWVDRNGWSQCHNKHEGKNHEPELEDESHRVDPEFPPIEVCPGCGSSQYCSHAWHKS